jgi:hypothetical protein
VHVEPAALHAGAPHWPLALQTLLQHWLAVEQLPPVSAQRVAAQVPVGLQTPLQQSPSSAHGLLSAKQQRPPLQVPSQQVEDPPQLCPVDRQGIDVASCIK